MAKQFYKCEGGDYENQVEADDPGKAAEYFASTVYYDGDQFDELAVLVTDADGYQHWLTVRAEPVQTIEFTAYCEEPT